jgi:hypothetical protein
MSQAERREEESVMRRRIGLVVLALALAVALSVYVSPESRNRRLPGVPQTNLPPNVTRWTDQEAGVVCYQLGQVSVSCVPLTSTQLQGK